MKPGTDLSEGRRFCSSFVLFYVQPEIMVDNMAGRRRNLDVHSPQ